MNEIHPPKGFIIDHYERAFNFLPDNLDNIWKKIQRRETFTQGQLFPYRVEFASGSKEGEFLPGELNIHHGPFLSVHGAIGEITDKYRGLDYYYGSYVLSFRLIRPVKLEFIRQDNKLNLRLTSYVRPWFKPIWRMANWILWTSFRYSL